MKTSWFLVIPGKRRQQELAHDSGCATQDIPEENVGCEAAANEDAYSESIAVPGR